MMTSLQQAIFKEYTSMTGDIVWTSQEEDLNSMFLQ